jgi:dihydrofolate reductase|tara:strand:+ start:866 stop:2110 length:1245 start_codon:yes stop_codon:yes gene_type:complete
MLATTSGVIHKNDVVIGRKTTEFFLKDQKNIFNNLAKHKNVVYNKQTFVKDVSLNYLNILPKNKIEETLKNVLLKEYYDCEKLYPYLGDYFLHKMFDNVAIKTSTSFVFNKKYQDKFISTLNNFNSKLIAKWIFENTNINRSINIEKYIGDDLTVEFLEEFVFNIDYDFSFFNDGSKNTYKQYKYVIINGIIESIGEIHHLLHKANKTKETFVIFCFGMSEEVKMTIIKNNKMGRFRVFPVCLNVNDENSLNLLNDIAAIHGSSIISSDLGQTISQETRKELSVGVEISFFKNSIGITPCVDNKSIEKHRNFLKKRIDDARSRPDVRIDVLANRLKMFTGKRVNIYIPEKLLKNKMNSREIDYFFRFISNLNKNLNVVSLRNQKFYIPSVCINIAEAKKKSLITKFSEISAIIS